MLTWQKTPLHLIGVYRIPRLPPLVQELWDHADKHDWNIKAIHGHVFRLGDTLCSTKELVEDTFGHSADAKRQNKNPMKCLAPERFHLLTSLKGRLDPREWPTLATVLDDWASTKSQPFSRRCNIGSFAPPSTTLKIFNACTLKKTGQGSMHTIIRETG